MKKEVMKQVNIDDEWYDIPDRAKWVAQDANGEWWWAGEFVVEPEDGIWGVDTGFIVRTGPPKDYTQELYELID